MKSSIEYPVDYINKVVDFRRDIFNRIADKDPNQIWLDSSLKDVKKVVVIAAASRSGSSLLFSILKRIPGIYSLSGENAPFYKLNGFSFGAFPSDEIPPGTVIGEDRWFNLSRDFLSDSASDLHEDSIAEIKEISGKYVDDLVLRFSLQWPTISFSYESFMGLAHQALKACVKMHEAFSKEEFYLQLLRELSREYKAINPYYYDIPVRMIQKEFPNLSIPSGPPCNELVIEEPPFILLPCRRHVNKDDLSNKILLVKSSVDCYRMHFLETIFPGADIQFIYLTRNPLASINGLYDGWLHRGFFSHNLSPILKSRDKMLYILGYSERYEWGKWWWNYDLPGGWQDYIHKRLEEVCAFQWHSANKALKCYFQESKKKYYHVRFENIINSLISRREEIDNIVNFIGLNNRAVKQLSLDKLPVVQMTEVPQLYRWKKRKDLLLPLLGDPRILGMSEELNYYKDNIEEWL